jgi:hypothetical protein
MAQHSPCPCCGYFVFAGPSGSYDICPICFWEDDIVQLAFPLMAGGANSISLHQSQKNFLNLGVSDKRFAANVRPPAASDERDASWRPFDPRLDAHLRWDAPEDRERWQNVTSDVCLYWWRSDYWLRGSSK